MNLKLINFEIFVLTTNIKYIRDVLANCNVIALILWWNSEY